MHTHTQLKSLTEYFCFQIFGKTWRVNSEIISEFVLFEIHCFTCSWEGWTEILTAYWVSLPTVNKSSQTEMGLCPRARISLMPTHWKTSPSKRKHGKRWKGSPLGPSPTRRPGPLRQWATQTCFLIQAFFYQLRRMRLASVSLHLHIFAGTELRLSCFSELVTNVDRTV